MLNNNLEKLKQAADFYRHYSNLRFAILAAFTALSVALISVFFGKNSPTGRYEVFLRFGGGAIAVVFGVYQYRLAWLVRHYQNVVKRIDGELGGPQSSPPGAWLLVIPGLVMLLHLGAVIFWIYAKR